MSSLPKMIVEVASNKSSGKLHVVQGELKRQILFRDGIPVNVASFIRHETLLKMLLDEGRITTEDFSAVLETMVASQRKAGEILIEMKLLTAEEVYAALIRQMKKKWLACFSLPEPQIEFEELAGNKVFYLAALNLVEMLWLGLRTHYNLERVTVLDPDFARNGLSCDLDNIAALQPYPWIKKVAEDWVSGNRVSDVILKSSKGPELLATVFLMYLFGGIEIHAAADVSATETLTGQKLTGDIAEQQDNIQHKHGLTPRKTKPVEDEEDIYEGIVFEFEPITAVNSVEAPGGEGRESETSEAEETLLTRYLKISSQNYFQILGVETRDANATIRKAYYDLVYRYNLQEPETFSDDPQKQEVCRKYLDQLTIAFRVVGNEDSRLQYLKFSRNEPGKTYGEVPPELEAEVESQKGEVYLKYKKFDNAIEYFSNAHKLKPKEASYVFLLGLTIYQRALANQKDLPDKCFELFRMAAKLDPTYDQPALFLGYCYKQQGKMGMAIGAFEDALERNEHCKSAISELRLAKLREGQKKK